ncbi:MAG: hypothetical protein WC413_01675 [Candidatus Nanoarchaeia archaeon]
MEENQEKKDEVEVMYIARDNCPGKFSKLIDGVHALLENYELKGSGNAIAGVAGNIKIHPPGSDLHIAIRSDKFYSAKNSKLEDMCLREGKEPNANYIGLEREISSEKKIIYLKIGKTNYSIYFDS